MSGSQPSAVREEPSPAPRPERTDEPRAVGGRRLLRRLGEGGMGSVYLGYDLVGRRPVAVKLLSDRLAGLREFVGRFYREARLSRELFHPNLVRGYDSGYDPAIGKHYLVLEYVDGPSARTMSVGAGRPSSGTSVRIGIDIARALHHLHAASYVHRDVKPDNVLVGTDGTAKLSDLGLAKPIDGAAHLTACDRSVGTSQYMPFEQALSSACVDARSDVFALGATLYHLLTGRVPFRGTTHEELTREKERGAFLPPRAVNPAIPPELDAIVCTALARDPRMRYQRAIDVADALERSLPADWGADGARESAKVMAAANEEPFDCPTRTDWKSIEDASRACVGRSVPSGSAKGVASDVTSGGAFH